MSLSKVLVANRGEIALRIVRACADEGLPSVVAASEPDVDSAAVEAAGEWICIGPGPALQSYLSIPSVVGAALVSGCDAIHPGYGFLSEQAALAEACAEHGLTFVGPPPDALRRGGDKVRARDLARSLGIPVGGAAEALDDAAEAERLAGRLGYPVLLKAASGGGGRGMVLVGAARDLRAAFARARSEAAQAFGDGRLYVERYMDNARHVEVQLLADGHGNVVALGTRDCSCQRRYQKVLEEAPAASVSPEVTGRLCAAAEALAQALSYVGAGTAEFLVDRDDGSFIFVELNARVQVEHPVTEAVTRVDVVREQLRIAGGAPLSEPAREAQPRGHAIECRIVADRPGVVEEWDVPAAPGVRVDSHCRPGLEVPPFYDALLGKLIVHEVDRPAAVALMARQLDRARVGGLPTNLPMLREIIAHPDFVADRLSTRWLESELLDREPMEA